MKRFLVLFLIAVLALSAAACGSDSEQSAPAFSNNANSEVNSKEPPKEPSKAESSEAESSTPETDTPKQEFIANFISIGAVDTKVNASSPNSIPLTGVDTQLTEGGIVLFYEDFDALKTDLTDFTVAVFEYSKNCFGYVLKTIYNGSADLKIEFPKDGFVLAIHSSQENYIKKIRNIIAEQTPSEGSNDVSSSAQTVFVHGLHLYDGADYTVEKAEKPFEIDGFVKKEGEKDSEWEDYLIDTVNAENPSWSYAQFEVNNYYSTANYYTAYDDDYLYLCVVVDSPYHYCPVSTTKPNDMYQYECIQVKVSSESPAGDYISENFDHVANNKAATEGVVRSYGFAVNDNGETCLYEGGITTEFTGKAACSRDDDSQTTVYEVAIPFAEFGIKPESGMTLGLTFSINSTNEDDVAKGVWKNITYRDGGGVIGRNDWSKIPVITLG